MSVRHREITVGLRDINHNAGRLFRSVDDSSELIVTDHGQPKWRVVPYVEKNLSVWDKMVENGDIDVIPDGELTVTPWVSIPVGISPQDTLSELRGGH